MIRVLWLLAGWFGIVAAFVFSLSPSTHEPSVIQHADKLTHLASYAMLMFWWAQLYITSRERLRLAVVLILLGIAIEWLQGFTSTRESDLLDVLANTTGILLGWLLAHHSIILLRFFPQRAVKSGKKSRFPNG